MKAFTVSSILTLALLATVEIGMAQPSAMSRATLNGVALDYEVWGNAGEPVVLVHAGIFADWFKPLRDEPALTGRHRVLSYHRVGYAGSSRVAGPVSLAQQAGHLRALMRKLGIPRAATSRCSSRWNLGRWCSRSC
jgi:hypothetical protein